jgi:hypothetical protein
VPLQDIARAAAALDLLPVIPNSARSDIADVCDAAGKEQRRTSLPVDQRPAQGAPRLTRLLDRAA